MDSVLATPSGGNASDEKKSNIIIFLQDREKWRCIWKIKQKRALEDHPLLVFSRFLKRFYCGERFEGIIDAA